MGPRLLAYGGTRYSERRKIGDWPPIPEGTLGDRYGVQAQRWSFGVGTVGAVPFLIFRRRQHVEDRGGYPFTLLLDPGESVWDRFRFNPAAVAASVLEQNSPILFETPESCSLESLANLLSALPLRLPDAVAPGLFGEALTASAGAAETVAVSPGAVGFGEWPEPMEVAAILAGLPECFRFGRGWLVGGGSVHGRNLGARLVLDDQAAGSLGGMVEVGRRVLGVWAVNGGSPGMAALGSTAVWEWGVAASEVFDAVGLIYELAEADSLTDELWERARGVKALRDDVEEAALGLMTGGEGELGPKGSAALLDRVLGGKGSLSAATVERLDFRTLADRLRAMGAPPKPVPGSIAVSGEVRVALWREHLAGLSTGVLAGLKAAGKEVPVDRVIDSAMAALGSSKDSLMAWKEYQGYPALGQAILQRLRSGDRDAAEAYLLYGDDPGGLRADGATRERLIEGVKALRAGYPKQANEWLRGKVASAKDSSADYVEYLRQRLFEGAPERATRVPNAPDLAARLEDMVLRNCEAGAARFLQSFSGEYSKLGSIFELLPEAACDRLVECLSKEQLASNFEFALTHPSARNAYSSALARVMKKKAPLLRQIGLFLTDRVMEGRP